MPWRCVCFDRRLRPGRVPFTVAATLARPHAVTDLCHAEGLDPPGRASVDFVSTSTGWALGDGTLLGTIDGGQHWRELGQPRPGPLRRVHFSSRTQGWGVAGGAGRGRGRRGRPHWCTPPTAARIWSALAAPAPPQSVCFTAPNDGWLASGTSVWRSTGGGRSWGSRPSFTLPVAANEPPTY